MKTTIKRLLLTVILSGVSAYTVFLNIGDWLSASDPPQKADIIISLSGTPDRIKKSAQLHHMGLAPRIMVMNDLDFKQLQHLQVSEENLLKAQQPAESTYQEGLLINQLLIQENLNSALIVTDPFHLYRAKWTLGRSIGRHSANLLFISTERPALHGFWWTNDQSRLFVLNELPKIVYYWIWHGILCVDDNPEWAVRLGKIYQGMLSTLFA